MNPNTKMRLKVLNKKCLLTNQIGRNLRALKFHIVVKMYAKLYQFRD